MYIHKISRDVISDKEYNDLPPENQNQFKKLKYY